MATTLQQNTYLRASGSIDILVGIWLVISPFLLGYSGNTSALWNDIISGILVIIFAATQTIQSKERITWPAWISLLIGIWLVLAPFALNNSAVSGTLWNEIISGIIIIALAAWAAFTTSSSDGFGEKM